MGPYPGNGRVLDPKVNSSQVLNATFPTHSQSDFAKLWSDVAAARATAPPSQEQWQSWWGRLALQQVQLAPITAFACSTPEICIGSDATTGHCICHTAGS